MNLTMMMRKTTMILLGLGRHQQAAADRIEALHDRRQALAPDDDLGAGRPHARDQVLQRPEAARALQGEQQAARHGAEGPERLPRDEARGLRALLLPLGRRPARDSLRDE